ncbi:hypothetical protein Trydic_g21216 [Trypoxylus dichotomus]
MSGKGSVMVVYMRSRILTNSKSDDTNFGCSFSDEEITTRATQKRVVGHQRKIEPPPPNQTNRQIGPTIREPNEIVTDVDLEISFVNTAIAFYLNEGHNLWCSGLQLIQFEQMTKSSK